MTLTLGDYFTLQRGTTYKGTLLGQPGPVLLGLASIARNGGFKGDNLKTYGGLSDDRIRLHPGDLYVSLKDVTQSADLLGAVAQVPLYIAIGRLTQDTVKLVPKKRDAPLRYLYWLMRSPVYREYCRAHSTGTTNLGLAREDFLAFPVPDLTQEINLIVDILHSIDEKIELNRRINETLEAMARAIFKDWFVDFGPTRAKAEGRAPYLADELWSIFPADLDGDIPVSWRLTNIAEVADVIMGASPDGSTYNIDRIGVPLINGPVEFGDYFVENIKWTTAPTRMSRKGDLIVCVRGSTTGRHAYADGEFCLGRGVCAIRAKGDIYSFVERNVLDRMPELLMKTTGSVFPNLSGDDIKQFSVLLPTPETLRIFESLGSPIRTKIQANVREGITLAQTRDLLLPKLMSGEIRVREAEALVEHAL